MSKLCPHCHGAGRTIEIINGVTTTVSCPYNHYHETIYNGHQAKAYDHETTYNEHQTEDYYSRTENPFPSLICFYGGVLGGLNVYSVTENIVLAFITFIVIFKAIQYSFVIFLESSIWKFIKNFFTRIVKIIALIIKFLLIAFVLYAIIQGISK